MPGFARPKITQSHAQTSAAGPAAGTSKGGIADGPGVRPRGSRHCALRARHLRPDPDGIGDAAPAAVAMPAGLDPMLLRFAEEVRARARMVRDHAEIKGPPDSAEGEAPAAGVRYDA